MADDEFSGKIVGCVTLNDCRKNSDHINSPSDSEMRVQNEQYKQGFLLASNLI